MTAWQTLAKLYKHDQRGALHWELCDIREYYNTGCLPMVLQGIMGQHFVRDPLIYHVTCLTNKELSGKDPQVTKVKAPFLNFAALFIIIATTIISLLTAHRQTSKQDWETVFEWSCGAVKDEQSGKSKDNHIKRIDMSNDEGRIPVDVVVQDSSFKCLFFWTRQSEPQN